MKDAAFGHGIARVDSKVEDHLPNLGGVQPGILQRVTQVCHQLNVLSDDAAQHVRSLAYYRVHVDDADLHNLLPTECQHLPGEGSGTVGRVGNLQQRLAKRIIRSDLSEHQFGRELDHDQDVVEIVSYASCQPRYCLQFLHLPDLLLEGALLRHVFDITGEVLPIGMRVPSQRTGDSQRHRAAITPQQVEFITLNGFISPKYLNQPAAILSIGIKLG